VAIVIGLRGSKELALLILIVSAAACSTATQGEIRPLLAPAAIPTPLAIAPTTLVGTTPRPTPKPKATPKPTKKPASGSYYKLPGWDGYSDVNCPDFDTHAHAQSFFHGTGGSTTNDPYRLDADHDGVACESLP
jgi:hypothetical protein